MKLLSDRT
jgi:chromosome segregation ATPase